MSKCFADSNEEREKDGGCGIIIPCHRVIGANGRLVGYGGGLDVKHTLLRHEGALPPQLLKGDMMTAGSQYSL